MAGAPLIHPVILAGGSGTRLWPLSRPWHPKPFVRLAGERTLLQTTVQRFAAKERFAPPLVICNRAHRFLVAEQMQQTQIQPRAIVLEPLLRNTAPAATIAALILSKYDPDGLLLLAPSDHMIGDPSALHSAIDSASLAAVNGSIVAFGVHPQHPATGYGYIKKGEVLKDCVGCFHIENFVEKPDRFTAEEFLASGEYAWNSGMFLASARSLIEEMAYHEPAIVDACRRAVKLAESDEDFLRLDQQAFEDQPSLPFDKAVMERTNRGAVVPIHIGWSDIGSWDALHQVTAKDQNGNVLEGAVVAVDNQNSYLRSEGPTLAAFGLESLAVVVTTDAILVCPRDRAQDLARLVDEIAGNPSYANLVKKGPGDDES